MKIILIIYLTLSVITLVFSYMTARYIADKFKRENPDLTIKKTTKLEKIMGWFRCILTSFCPILHTLTLLVWLLAWDLCVEKMMDKIFEDLVE